MSGSVFLTALCVSLMIALMFANPLAKPRIREPVRSRALPSWLPPLLVLVGSSVLIGGALGIALGVLLAIASGFALPRFESAIGRRDRLARERQLPLFVDLVAACLSAGVPTDDALMAAGAAVGAPSIRWGAEPVRTWSSVQSIDGMGQLAGALVRSAESGAPLAELLPALAQDAREMRRARVEAKTRTAGVRLMAPLGLTFLPAFILLGVVPVVASWATLLLGNN